MLKRPLVTYIARKWQEFTEHGCTNAINSKLILVGRGYSWMCDPVVTCSLVLILKNLELMSRVVVVVHSRASRVFLRVLLFSCLRKINTYT